MCDVQKQVSSVLKAKETRFISHRLHFSVMCILIICERSHTYQMLQCLAGSTGTLEKRPAADHSLGCEHLLWDPSLEV